jgi:hypothetical protein
MSLLRKPSNSSRATSPIVSKSIWTPSFNETQILDLKKFEACRSYIHQNPVRAKLVPIAEEFPYSSAGQKHSIDPTPEHLAGDRTEIFT